MTEEKQEAKPQKICPVMFRPIQDGTFISGEIYCYHEKCAWWDAYNEHVGRCAQVPGTKYW